MDITEEDIKLYGGSPGPLEPIDLTKDPRRPIDPKGMIAASVVLIEALEKKAIEFPGLTEEIAEVVAAEKETITYYADYLMKEYRNALSYKEN
jgi:hypothetical protein